MTTSTPSPAATMREAIQPVLDVGPEFLAGRAQADDMAHTMVRAVEVAATVPSEPGYDHLLAELHTCGTGYLAGRCEADCVARTMTQVMGEYGPQQ